MESPYVFHILLFCGLASGLPVVIRRKLVSSLTRKTDDDTFMRFYYSFDF